jgi:tRNA threonylcarbamoyl adenosine modification protein YeaZ
MRVLGIETSSRRGSVALLERGELVAAACHEELNAHAERLLPLIDQVLADAGWSRTRLNRVAVGVGPGSFTGLRVGIALGQGISVGLGIELVGVGSLRAMAAAVPSDRPGVRWALLDARRGEVFVAAYDEAGRELLSPRAIPPFELEATMAQVPAPGPRLLLGEVLDVLPEGLGTRVQSHETDLPHASSVALLGERATASEALVEPLYVRDAGAALPRQS